MSETMLTERLEARELLVFLVDVTHVTFTYVATYCSVFGTRFDSIVAALFDRSI